MARVTFDSGIKARSCYPLFGSLKSESAKYVNVDLRDDEAERLAVALRAGASASRLITIRIARQRNRAGTHAVTVTADRKHAKT